MSRPPPHTHHTMQRSKLELEYTTTPNPVLAAHLQLQLAATNPEAAAGQRLGDDGSRGLA